MTAIAVGASIYTAVAAKKQADDAASLALEKEGALEDLEADRQAVVNPYADMTNQYANLSVATQAAKFQSQEADKSLANTLDMMRAGGFSAGGATALARAAAQGKQGVAASIEQQEAQNERLKAQGAQQVEQMIAQGEGMRGQAQEEREMQKLDRTQAQIDNARAQEIASKTAMIGAFGNIASSAISGAMNIPTKTTPVDPNATPATVSGVVDDSVFDPYAGNLNVIDPVVAGAGVNSSGQTIPGTQVNVTPGQNLTGQFPIWTPSTSTAITNPYQQSDRRLKKDIKLIGISPSGLNIYKFKYKNDILGEGIWQGVMSDEIPKIAVIKGEDGYDKVDYSKLDVEFKKYI